ILAEHDVHESYSGDGLIVAKFGAVPSDWRCPRLTYNRYSESLFRNPLYDLAAATTSPPVADSRYFAEHGGLLRLTADCALGKPGDTVLLPFDQAIFPRVMSDGGWAPETLAFLDEHIDPTCRYVVLDIGANVGLFTRQAVLRYSNLSRVLCIEPDPGNFRALRYNLANVADERISLWNVALSDADGEAQLLRDAGNFGNYSLNDDAMRDRRFDTIGVRAVETNRWMRENIRLPVDDRVIWKSDTQGYDELIISLTPAEIWDRVDLAIVELWRIRKPAFDRTVFFDRIDAFPNKSIGRGNRSTTADVMDFLKGDDWHFEDLYLW